MNRFAGWMLGCLLLTAATPPLFAAPLGTAFTYQGKLDQSGSPVTGVVHFRFSLWDAPTSGTQIGAHQIVPSVPVTGGVFTVQLNAAGEFTAQAFDEARWLEIEVCTTPTCGTRTLLSPRQPITASPYSLQSKSSESLENFGGGVVSEIYPGNATNSPGLFTNRLHHDLLMGSFLEGSLSHGFLSTGYNSQSRKLSLGRASSSDFSTAVFQPLLTVVSNTGNVGIGTASPTDKLQVAGTARVSGDLAAESHVNVTGQVRMGGSQDLATGGREELRIIRGSVNGCANGQIEWGSGFTLEPGCATNDIRTITFDVPFSQPPTVVATAKYVEGSFVRLCEIVSVSTTQVRIAQYYRHDGSYIGGPFHFIAIGPR